MAIQPVGTNDIRVDIIGEKTSSSGITLNNTTKVSTIQNNASDLSIGTTTAHTVSIPTNNVNRLVLRSDGRLQKRLSRSGTISGVEVFETVASATVSSTTPVNFTEDLELPDGSQTLIEIHLIWRNAAGNAEGNQYSILVQRNGTTFTVRRGSTTVASGTGFATLVSNVSASAPNAPVVSWASASSVFRLTIANTSGTDTHYAIGTINCINVATVS